MRVSRRERLAQLDEAVAAAGAPETWSRCLAAGFQLFYGLPVPIQMAAGRFMVERYLPIFEARHPEVTWARELLRDVPGWYARHGRAVPDLAGPLDMADAVYQGCFDALLYAHHHRGDAASLAAAVCCAAGDAAHAQGLNVWIADAPESVLVQEKIMEIGRTGDPYPESGPWSSERLFAPEHQPLHHVGYVAMARDEWAALARWAHAEGVARQADSEDPEAVARALRRWEEREFLLMRPEAEEG